MEDDGLSFVKLRGSVNYEEDMPKVFARSKINMNFTIRNIRTGLPLRIWDILGAGGFLLTNYQIELNDFFENGKDLVYYESLDDMERKADYYLNHEEERKMIAENGHRKVMRYHSYDARIAEMLERAGEM
jgi:spore maturation protein CgeB